jgi:hypothetical protein
MIDDWTKRPWASALLCFACQPSTLLHESRINGLIPESARMMLAGIEPGTRLWRNIHRHWSIALNKVLALPPLVPTVPLFKEPSLPLALLRRAQFEELRQLAGALLAGPLIRHSIRREHQKLLQKALGEPLYRFALSQAPAIHGGLRPSLSRDVHDLAADVPAWGDLLIARAIETAPPEIAERVRLRLPKEAPDRTTKDLPLEMDADQALGLLNALIETMDPQWLSSFRAPA